MQQGCAHRYSRKKFLPFPANFLFDIVADVASYPEFLPWCTQAVIHQRTENSMYATLSIGYLFYKETFCSHITLKCPTQIDVVSTNGPLKYLNNVWRFDERPQKKGTHLSFYVDFSFNSSIVNAMMSCMFPKATMHMAESFEKRAQERWHQNK